jgi:hypothetical protein
MKRVIILFLVKQLVLIGILFLALDLYPDFSIDGQRSGDVKIKIGNGDISSGVLKLTPAGRVPVYEGKNVIWSVKSASNVKSFQIAPKGPSEDVFEGGPPRGDRQDPGVGKLKERDDTIDYVYEIIWYDTADGGPHTHDPKIAVKPSTFLLDWLIYILYGLFAGLISFLTFRKK